MSRLGKLLAVASAATMIAAPLAANAAPRNAAGALSLKGTSVAQGGAVRAGTSVKRSSGIGAAIYPLLIVAIVGATVGFGISNDDDEADSA